MYRDNRPGCLMGLLQLFLLDKLFRWLQRGIGFGSGSLPGCGCGPILLVIFVLMACGIFSNDELNHTAIRVVSGWISA